MKILAVNKFYYMKGGCESYYFSLNKILAENGHEIIPFSMKDKKNFETKYEKYFINNIDYSKMSLKTKVINAAKIIYSTEAYKKIRKIVEIERPDFVHLHNFQHQLSPAILHALKKFNIPIVLTVHDLKVICPNYQMLNKNGVCEECKNGRYYNCIKNSCVKGSKANSIVCAVETYLHKYLKSYSYIDKFICPSEFYRKKFVEFGIEPDRVVHLPNFIDVKSFEPRYECDDYFAYVGRLSKEKGLMTLIRSMRFVEKSKLLVIGTGPFEEQLKNEAEKLKLNNVEFLGFKTGDELKKIIQNSKFLVIPSEWYENCPMSVIEAMAYGKAVVGSNLGGIPELIENNVTGAIFEAGNEEDLSNKINNFIRNSEEVILMGKHARKKAEELYDENIHYNSLLKIYNKLI